MEEREREGEIKANNKLNATADDTQHERTNDEKCESFLFQIS